ncbi:MAG: sigma-70 family RNA polymerase sigma factor [Acidobacteria bacterium]|nr:sigma-70 family RNA polymerase sigma factor [Acidobacteriota bacterium]
MQTHESVIDQPASDGVPELVGLSDLELLGRIASDRMHSEAYSILFERHLPVLRQRIRTLVPDEAAAIEVASDAMSWLWENATVLKGILEDSPVEVGEYLQRITVGRAREYARRAGAPPVEAGMNLRPGVSIDLKRGLGKLREQDRLLIESWLEGQTTQETAHQIGSSPGAVAVRRHRALLHLKRILASDERPV